MYLHTDGSVFRVFVTESEDDGSQPTDSPYWNKHFSDDVTYRHVYQGMIDYEEKYNISNGDI